MTPLSDVLVFHRDDRVEDAARAMAERSVGGAPVVDGDGTVIGLLNDDDLIVQDVRLHVPTVLSLLGGLGQINPIWLYGPFHPAAVTTAAQPDWYVGWLEGALRLFPATS